MADEKKDETALMQSVDMSNPSTWLTPETGEVSQDLTGTEDIGIADIRLPRLAIAQGLSDQMLPDNSKYIPDLKLFQMFNDLTGEIYGNGPLYFVPVKRDVRYIEFKPRSEGGGVLDLNVPPNDPRTLWRTDPTTGDRLPPRATEFIEFVIILLRQNHAPEPIVLSIKTTNKWNREAAIGLTSFVKLRRDAIYAGLYTVQSKSEKNDQGTFGVYVTRRVGKAAIPIRNYAKEFHEQIKDRPIIIEREPGMDDDFDPNTIEGQTVPAAPEM